MTKKEAGSSGGGKLKGDGTMEDVASGGHDRPDEVEGARKEDAKPMKKPPPSTTNTATSNAKGVRWSSDVKDHAKEPKKLPSSNSSAETASASPDASGVARLPTATATTTPTVTFGKQHQESVVMLEDNWELTWPIWHLLPLHERREIAKRHGYTKIGDFEEYMSLQQALDNKDQPNSTSRPYANELAYLPTDNKQKPEQQNDGILQSEEEDDEGEEEDSDLEEGEDQEDETEQGALLATTEDTAGDIEASDSMLLTFPDEILHNIFSFLPVTLYGTKLAYVSRTNAHWRRLTNSEPAMKQLCERVYLQQSKKKQLRASKFYYSYRYMLYSRPRVQAGGGVYILRFGRVKPIQRDMWTQVPPGAVLETVYYRYLYFEEHGHCLYALTTIPPHDMLKRFHRVLLQSSRDNFGTTTSNIEFAGKNSNNNKTAKKKPRKLTQKEREQKAAEMDTRVVWGTYTIQKDKITVTAKQSWQTVQFGLRIVTHHNRPFSEHTYLHHHQNNNNNNNSNKKPAAAPKPAVAKNKPSASLKTTGEHDNDDDDNDNQVHEYVKGWSIPKVSPHGRFGVLQLEQHRSSISGNFEEHDTFLEQLGGGHPQQVFHHSDVVNYDVEGDQVFRFVADPRF